MSSLPAAASLIVAGFDLLAVRAVTGAIRAADLASGDVLTPSGIVEKPQPPPGPSPDAYHQNYQQVQPRTLSPHQTTHASPSRRDCTRRRLQSSPREAIIIPACDLPSVPACMPFSPIEPPWKVLPWMDRPHQRIVFVKPIKRVITLTDMSGRGRMIDVVA